MAEQIQVRRGSTTQHATFTGADGEITVDTSKRTIVVHDGATAGGFSIPTKANGTFDKITLTDNGGDAQTWVIEEDSISPTNALVFSYAGTERGRLSSIGRITVSELEFTDTSSNSQTWKLNENPSDKLSIIHGAAEVASISSAGDLTFGNILDSNGNEKLVLMENASAVNEVWISNAATGSAPNVFVNGGDPDIDLKLSPKGTGSIDVDLSRIINVDDPTSAQDAATKNYVDTNTIGAIVDDTSPQLGGNLDAAGFAINNLLDPVSVQDAATKNYVDTQGFLTDIVSDSSPQLGGDLDIQSFTITTSTTDGDIALSPDGTGSVVINSPLQLATFTVATLPVTGIPGQMVFVEDGDAGSPTVAVWDGSNWRVLQFGPVAST